MNKLIASTLAVLLTLTPAALMTASSASATETAEARVVSHSTESRLLRLSDGKTYILPANFDRTGLSEGAEVLVSWVENGQSRVVREITAN